ncbi:MAG: SAM-dependent methyltransferase [Candidatus Acidiferrales bacterium]
MAAITIVGIGPGPISYLTKEAEQELLRAAKIFFRTGAHPVHDWLQGLGKQLVCFDQLYAFAWPEPGMIYEFMVKALFKEVELRGQAIYAVPGSPVVLEDTTRLLRLRGAKKHIEVRLIHGLSFLELALAEINCNFLGGLQIVLPLTHLREGRYRRDSPLMACQIDARSLPLDKPRVDLTMAWLLESYPPEHSVTLIWTDGLPCYETQSKVIELKNLVREYGDGRYFASLYVPPL